MKTLALILFALAAVACAGPKASTSPGHARGVGTLTVDVSVSGSSEGSSGAEIKETP